MTQLQHPSSNAAFAPNALVGVVVVHPRVKARNADETETGRNAFPLYDHGGTIVVAGAWLAFYAFAAIHDFLASGF